MGGGGGKRREKQQRGVGSRVAGWGGVCVCVWGGGGGALTSSRKDWAELNVCIRYVSKDQSLQWQSFENLSFSLSVSERDR